MLPCKGCAYSAGIPGDCHIRCEFDWATTEDDPPRNASSNPRTAQWFRFPFNYDPVWGPDECTQKSGTRVLDAVVQASPLRDLISLLRSQGDREDL